ncbi:MAG TPA: hypothetical protein VJP86_07020 [Vicinamibacterales bacterium]|jgi:hypothetical protein|nr:hypothetical protein [Vicinamibacterales bacterium]
MRIATGVLGTGLLLMAAACANSNDQKVADLEKQLKATQDQLAAQQTQPVPPAGDAAATTPAPADAGTQAGTPAAASAPKNQLAASSSTPAKPGPPQSTAAAAQPKPAPGVTAEQYAADKETVRNAAEQQRTVNAGQAQTNAQQAATNAQVQQQIESLKPIEVTLPAGLVIPARTSSEVSTSKVKNGSVFEALLDHDLVVDGTTVAKKGARVTGLVVSSDPGGKVKGTASLEVTVRQIQGTKGLIAIRTDNYSTEAESTKKKDVTRTGVMTGAGAVIGAIAGGGKGAAIGAGVGAGAGVGTAMATRGDAATIPAETLIEFKLTSPVTVTIPR